MDLIFTNALKIDQGVLQDYSFDEEYGIGQSDTNTFECRIQKYNDAIVGGNGVEPISEDSLLYIEFTEYGGIVDRIESDVRSGVITLVGRTWHGILNSFYILPPSGNIYRTYDGEINDILQEIINDIGMSDLFVVDIITPEQRETESYEIHDYRVRYEKAYDCICRMMDAAQCKLIMYFQNYQVHLGVVLACNYATMEEFDSSQIPYKVGKTYNNVNHMICLGAGDAQNRAVIHLFVDDDTNSIDVSLDEVQLRPYTKVDKPNQDSDYILDTSQQQYFGLQDIQYLYDAPNADITINYLPLTTKPIDWNGQYYQKYYYRDIDDYGNDVYKLFSQVFKDEYDLLPNEPSDWQTNFQDYYYWDAAKDPQYYKWDEITKAWAKCSEEDPDRVLMAGGFVSVKALPESTAPAEYRIINAVTDWGNNYGKYYLPVGVPDPGQEQQYESVKATQEVYYGAPVNGKIVKDAKLTQEPADWANHFSNYYTWYAKDVYQKPIYRSVAGVVQYENPVLVRNKKEPANWKQNWGSYYVKYNTKKKLNGNPKLTFGKASYITAAVAVQIGQLDKVNKKDYVKYKANAFYTIKQKQDAAPSFNSKKTYNSGADTLKNGVYVKYSKEIKPEWRTNTYYERIVNTVPRWQAGVESQFTGYYSKSDKPVEQIPNFDPNNTYYAVEDRYKVLVEAAKEKLKDIRDTSSLDIDLELESNYDILDTVGCIDQVTGIDVNKKIKRKIIKIKKDLVTIDYEVD